MSEWISVEDRLPKSEELVLFWVSKYSLFVVGRTITREEMRFSSYFWECSSGEWNYMKEAVSHWMPLPEAPRGN